MKILLVGDSTFDNAPYTGIDDCILTKMKSLFPNDTIDSIATDGFTTKDVINQLRLEQPVGYDYVFYSIGGNDLIHAQEILLVDKPTAAKKAFHFKLLARHCKGYKYLESLNGKVFVFALYTPVFGEDFDEFFVDLAQKAINKFNIMLKIQYTDTQIVYLGDVVNEADDFINYIEPSAKASVKVSNLIKGIIENEEASHKAQESVI